MATARVKAEGEASGGRPEFCQEQDKGLPPAWEEAGTRSTQRHTAAIFARLKLFSAETSVRLMWYLQLQAGLHKENLS